jgi:hypothetical protein
MNTYTIGIDAPTKDSHRSWMLMGDNLDLDNDGTLDQKRIIAWLATVPKHSLVLTDVESKLGGMVAKGDKRALRQMVSLSNLIMHLHGHYGYVTTRHRDPGTQQAEIAEDARIAALQTATFIREADFVCQSFYMHSHHSRDMLGQCIDATATSAKEANKPVHITLMTRYTEADDAPVQRLQPISLTAFTEELHFIRHRFASHGTPVVAAHFFMELLSFMRLAHHNADARNPDGTHVWNLGEQIVIRAAAPVWGTTLLTNGVFDESRARKLIAMEAAEYIGVTREVFATTPESAR